MALDGSLLTFCSHVEAGPVRLRPIQQIMLKFVFYVNLEISINLHPSSSVEGLFRNLISYKLQNLLIHFVV